MEIALPSVLLTLLFLNGATDAAGAVATAVASGALSSRTAARLAAAMNLAGGIFGGLCLPAIADSVGRRADFGAYPRAGALASLLATAIFAALAWGFGVPTSESHALLAATAGASLLLGGASDPLIAIAPAVLYMTLSAAVGLGGAALFARRFPAQLSRARAKRIQILLAAAAAFLHGVQDLAKLLALGYAAGIPRTPVSLTVGAAVLAVGTLCGGQRMTDAMGNDLASLTARGALAAECGTAAGTVLASLLGLPISATHTKTAAVATSALLCRGCALYPTQLRRFIFAWILTFPASALLGWTLAFLLRS